MVLWASGFMGDGWLCEDRQELARFNLSDLEFPRLLRR